MIFRRIFLRLPVRVPLRALPRFRSTFLRRVLSRFAQPCGFFHHAQRTVLLRLLLRRRNVLRSIDRRVLCLRFCRNRFRLCRFCACLCVYACGRFSGAQSGVFLRVNALDDARRRAECGQRRADHRVIRRLRKHFLRAFCRRVARLCRCTLVVDRADRRVQDVGHGFLCALADSVCQRAHNTASDVRFCQLSDELLRHVVRSAAAEQLTDVEDFLRQHVNSSGRSAVCHLFALARAVKTRLTRPAAIGAQAHVRKPSTGEQRIDRHVRAELQATACNVYKRARGFAAAEVLFRLFGCFCRRCRSFVRLGIDVFLVALPCGLSLVLVLLRHGVVRDGHAHDLRSASLVEKCSGRVFVGALRALYGGFCDVSASFRCLALLHIALAVIIRDCLIRQGKRRCRVRAVPGVAESVEQLLPKADVLFLLLRHRFSDRFGDRFLRVSGILLCSRPFGRACAFEPVVNRDCRFFERHLWSPRFPVVIWSCSCISAVCGCRRR